MTDKDWSAGFTKFLALRLAGDAINEPDEKGRPIVDDTLIILINGHHAPLAFTLPAHKRGVRWQPILDTSVIAGAEKPVAILKGDERYELEGRSIVVLKLNDKE